MGKIRSKNRIFVIFDVLLAIVFVLFLRNTDAYLAPYIIVALFGIGSSYLKTVKYGEERFIKGLKITVIVLSILFGLLCIAANYRVLNTSGAVICAVCGFRMAYNFLSLIAVSKGEDFKRLTFKVDAGSDSFEKSAKRVFFITAAIIIVVDCLILFLGEYPGVLTEDSISQLEQLTNNVYSNHHPFYHTMIIKLFVTIGLKVFGGDYNKAIALYNVFQIIVMGCTFGYINSTLKRIGIKNIVLVIITVWFAFVPCHFMYSFTIWKDVLFASAISVFFITVFRMQNGFSKKTFITWELLILSGIGSCLFRSNGLMSVAVASVIFILLFRKSHKKMCFTLIGIIVISIIMKGLVLNAIGVSKTDTIESLSIPVQQIARVITEDRYCLSEEDERLLFKVIDIDQVGVNYSEFISNPIKELVRATGDQEYLKEHIFDYFKLWLRLGISHPKEYFKAYVEQTKGIWNSGYEYWKVTDIVDQSNPSFGLTKQINEFYHFLWRYNNRFDTNPVLCIFESTGLHVWLMIALMFLAISRGNKIALFAFIFFVIYIVTLLVASPVFAEFRYTYNLFCIFPFLVFSPLYGKDN